MSTPSTVPSWVKTAETWGSFTESVISALLKALEPGASSGGGSVASTPGINLGLDPLPEISTGFTMLGDALVLANTIEGAKLTPQYTAAVELQKKKALMDQIRENEQKAEQGDQDALNKMRENIS